MSLADERDGSGRDTDRPLLVGVDIGGTKIAVLVVDRAERVLAREVAHTAAGPQDGATDQIAAVIDRTLRSAGARIDDVAAIGVGVPGRVDPLTGAVTLAVNLGWSDLPLGAQLEARFGRPCVVENDVRAAAFGLHRRRVVGEIDDLAYLAVGTGVSAGVVLHGRLHRGARGLAGEIGHVVVDPGGARCACGERGCLETFISGSAIARLACEAIDVGRPTALRGTTDPTAVDVYHAAAAGDPVGLEIAEAVGRRLAWAIHLLVMTYDVERVVLGGGVSHAGATFLRPIEEELDRLRATSELAREQLVPGVAQLLPPGADAGAWGAVSIAEAGQASRPAPTGDVPHTGDQRREVGHVRDT
ncbi:MAG: ROK family protein [Candidatus Limnocylindrales bacterium]